MIQRKKAATTTFQYDARGNRTTITDAVGRITSFQYDAMNRLTRAMATYPEYVAGEGRACTELMRAMGSTDVWRRDATSMGLNRGPGYGLVFLDPPYGKGLGEKAMLSAHKGGWLAPGALVILEERGDVQVTVDPVFAFTEERTFGDTKMYFFSYRPA